MFDTLRHVPFPSSSPTRRPQTAGASTRPPLDPALASRVRPTTHRRDRRLPVLDPLAPLLPDAGLTRGTVLTVGGREGATTLALGLAAAASEAGAWCAVVGVPDPGVLAMAELGVSLDRLLLVPRPAARWPQVTALLLSGVDIVVLRPAAPIRPAAARRLTALARQEGSVLIVVGGSRWAEGADLELEVERSHWHSALGGAESDHGETGGFRGRWAEVRSAGRRAAARPMFAALWLPGPAGAVTAA